MNKQEILKKEGLTEEQFYKLYPTEQAYLMKCGGTMKAQLGQQIPPPIDYGYALLMQDGGKPVPGDDSSTYLKTRSEALQKFLKGSQHAFDRSMVQDAQQEFMGQFQGQGMPMAQDGKILNDEFTFPMDYNPIYPISPAGTHYWNGSQYNKITGLDQWKGYQTPSQDSPNFNNVYRQPSNIDPSLAPTIPGMAGDESIPEPQHEMSNDYLRKMISSNTWQGGLPGQTYMANSQYDLGEMMDVENSHKNDKTAQTGTKGMAGNFDWMGLVNMINTGVGTMAQQGEFRKEEAWRKAHRPKPEDWSAIYQPYMGDHTDGARFSGSHLRPNQTQYGMYGNIAKFGGDIPKASHGAQVNKNLPQNTWYTDNVSGKDNISVGRTLAPVNRAHANVIAEKGEIAVADMNFDGIPESFVVGGDRHSAPSGGTPLNLPPDSFIFSDTSKMKIKDKDILARFGMSKGSYTPADIAKKYDLNKFRGVLYDKDADKIQTSTAESMIQNYNLKLGELSLVQESKKGFPQGLPSLSFPYLEASGIDPEQILPSVQQGQPQMAQNGGLVKAQMGYSFDPEVNTSPYVRGKIPQYFNNLPLDQKMNRPNQWGQLGTLWGDEGVYEEYPEKRDSKPGMSLSEGRKLAEERKAKEELDKLNYIHYMLNLNNPEETEPSEKPTGYWDQAWKQNIISRIFSDQEADPRMQTAAEKLIPFVGEDVDGAWDWTKTLLTAPQKELNHLISGDYAPFYETYKKYHQPSGTAEFMTSLADPLLAPGKALIVPKYAGKAAAKALPYAGAAAAATYHGGKQAAKYIGKKAAEYLPYLIPNVKDPETLARAAYFMSMVGQKAVTAGDEESPLPNNQKPVLKKEIIPESYIPPTPVDTIIKKAVEPGKRFIIINGKKKYF